jgi:tetratricopeptide (TPR) repeat protein
MVPGDRFWQYMRAANRRPATSKGLCMIDGLRALYRIGTSISAGILIVAAGLLWAAHVQAQADSSPDAALAGMVAQELTKLGVKPKTAVLPSDRALEVTIAIRNGDYATARRVTEEVLAASNLQSWRFYPFSEFMAVIGRGGDDSALLEHLNIWVEREPKSAVAHLIRARYYLQAGWAARGEGMSNLVPRRKMDEFVSDMALAKADIQTAVKLNPRNPWGYYELLDVILGGGNSADMDAAFQAGIKAFPSYYELYRMRLYSLTPKWGGSIKAMYDFVDQYAGKTADQSALRLLHLQLYSYLLDAAWYDCVSGTGDRQQCINAAMNRTVSPVLADQTLKALSLFKTSDPVQFNTAIRPILQRLVITVGSGSSGLGTLMQLAATAMGSDNRLSDEPVQNSYVLDDITAQIWVQMGSYGNAEDKFTEALRDVEHTVFPDEAQKDIALATIYDDMADSAAKEAQSINVIVFHDASVAYGGNNFGDVPYRKCYAYYQLKHFAEAVTECTNLIDGTGNYLITHYWRAKAYEGLKQWDAALADFSPVADGSENWYRVGAALDMSHVLAQKHDYAGVLASLNGHPWLYDASLQSPDDLAVSYNNRCFAYMKLGDLQKALDDCTASLKYGHIPDAFQKQQELIKKLAAKPETGA